jgi:hypothetical protein
LEYKQGVAWCPDCEQELLDWPPPEAPEGEHVAWVRLTTVGDPSEGDVVVAGLGGSGIPAYVRRHGPITGELGRVTDGMTEDYAIVYVPDERLEEARGILDGLHSSEVEWPEGMEPDDGEDEE